MAFIPSSASYSAISLNSNTQLMFPLFPVPGGTIITDIMDITPAVANLVVTLPDATNTSPGQNYLINNKSTSFSFSINDNAGTSLVTINANSSYILYLTNTANTAGQWQVITLSQAGNNPITSISSNTNDADSVNLVTTNGTGPNTSLALTVSNTLQGINDTETTGDNGYLTHTGSDSWTLRELTSGNGIVLTNADGLSGNPQVALSSSVNAMTLGNFQFNGSTLGNATAAPLTITTTGANIILNGIIITPQGNVSSGGLGASIPIAWVVFKDSEISGAPTIEDSFNVTSITEDGTSPGIYTITFSTAANDAEYGVIATAGSRRASNNSPFVVQHAFPTSRTTTSVTIAVTTSAGELTPRADEPITVVIFNTRT